VVDNPSGRAIRRGDVVDYLAFGEWLAR
jgi:hypothetical protein